MEKFSITAVVPALNEEPYLKQSIDTIVDIFSSNHLEYEILIINDGSTDRTGKIAEHLSISNPYIRVIHHPTPKGLASSYKEGIKLVKTQFVIMLTANYEDDKNSTNYIIKQMGTADMIVPYPENINKRQLNRRIASKLFTAAVRQISGIKLKYFNGSVLHRTELINSIKIKTNSYAYQAEALTKLINQGFSYKEVPMTVNYNQHSSNAFKIRNFLGIVKFFIFLVGNSFTKKYVKKTTKAQ